jgi:hypothetical protein
MNNKDLNYASAGNGPSARIVCSYDTSYEHSLEHHIAVRSMLAKPELGGTAVLGIYRDLGAVDHAVDALREVGFRSTDIAVLFTRNESTKDCARNKHTQSPEAVAPGAAAGAEKNGNLNGSAGTEGLSIAGAGPLGAVGPIVSAPAGAGAEGILAESLVSMGVPECEAKRRYHACVKEGGILLSVHADNADGVGQAKIILERTRADDISVAAEQR